MFIRAVCSGLKNGLALNKKNRIVKKGKHKHSQNSFFHSSDMVRIEATVVEKTLSEKKILFRFKRRMNYKRYKGDEIL